MRMRGNRRGEEKEGLGKWECREGDRKSSGNMEEKEVQGKGKERNIDWKKKSRGIIIHNKEKKRKRNRRHVMEDKENLATVGKEKKKAKQKHSSGYRVLAALYYCLSGLSGCNIRSRNP